MRKSLITLSLVSFLMQSTGIGFAQAGQGAQGRESLAVQKARTGVAKATGSKVTVTLNNNSKLKGFILNAGNDCFTLVDSKTGNANCIDYANVLRIKRQGQPAWQKLLLVGAAVAIPMVIVAVALRDY